MVSEGDDQHGEDSLGEKRSLELLATLLLAYGDEEIRARRGKEEQDRNMFMIETIISAATKTLLGKRKFDHNCENQQNPNYRHDYASSSSSSSSSSLSDEPIRAEPIREIKPPVRKRNRPVRREPEETPEWVVKLMRKKNGADVKMIIKKKLKASDVKENQARLLIPFNQITEMDFLNEEELNIIEEHRIKIRKKGVDVWLVDSIGEVLKLNLRRWNMNTSSNYVLCTGWNNVLHNHNLEKNQTIRLWSFHSENKLYFAFAPSTLAPDVAQAMAQPQAQDPALPIPAARDFDELFLCEETNRILFPSPKRRRTFRAPTRYSSNLSQSILEDLDLNRTVPEVCMEMAPLEAVQETNRRTSLVSVTETSQVSDTETSQVSDTETTTLDLELRL